MGKVYSMTIKYLDSKRISTSPSSATSVQGYSQLNAGTNGWNIASGAGDGERLSLQIVSGSSIIADPIKEIKMKLYKNSSPTDTLYVRVRNSSDTILAEASKVASTLTGSLTEYTFTLNTGVILAQGDRINIEYTGSSGSGNIGCGVNNATEPSTVNCQKYDGTSYSDIDRTPDWQFDSSPSTTISILQSKPTSVQDNSILVEKDTGERYWFDAESNATVTKDYPMTTDPRTNTFNTSGVTTITHANSTLQLNQINSSSSMGASTYIDLGSDLSTKWVMRFRTNQSGYTNYAYNSQMQVGMSSVAPTSTAYNISSSLNWIGFRWYFGTQFSATYQGIEPRIGQNTGDNTHNNSTARLYGNPNNTTNTGTSYYHEFIWNVDTFTYNLYDNANYTGTKLATAIMSSSTNTNWVTGTPSSVSGLRYLVFKIGADTNGGLWVNQLDDVKIYDGVTSVTTPATWTMEPTFEDDFTSYADQTAADLAWVSQETASTRVNVTNDNLAFSVTGTSNKGISYDLGVGNVSDTTWILQYTLAHTTYTNGSGYGQYWIGLSSADSATLYGGAQDSISSRYNRDTAMRVEASDNSDMGNQGGTDGVDLANNTTYYVDLIRDGTSITRNIYTDSARTGTIFSTSTLTISGTITGLRYFVLRNDSASGTNGNAIGTIDDIRLYNGVTTPN